jgi:hypothetical protein
LNRIKNKKKEQLQIDQEYIQKFRVFIILPEVLKNRLILLVIIWAK